MSRGTDQDPALAMDRAGARTIPIPDQVLVPAPDALDPHTAPTTATTPTPTTTVRLAATGEGTHLMAVPSEGTRQCEGTDVVSVARMGVNRPTTATDQVVDQDIGKPNIVGTKDQAMINTTALVPDQDKASMVLVVQDMAVAATTEAGRTPMDRCGDGVTTCEVTEEGLAEVGMDAGTCSLPGPITPSTGFGQMGPQIATCTSPRCLANGTSTSCAKPSGTSARSNTLKS